MHVYDKSLISRDSGNFATRMALYACKRLGNVKKEESECPKREFNWARMLCEL